MILIIDTDRDSRRVLRRLLGDCGHCVLCVTDGSEALEVMRTTKPDLVLLDWSNHRGGLELLTDIRSDAELPAVPVLAYCAEANDGYAGLALAAGAQGLLHHDDRDFGELRRAAEHFDPVAY